MRAGRGAVAGSKRVPFLLFHLYALVGRVFQTRVREREREREIARCARRASDRERERERDVAADVCVHEVERIGERPRRVGAVSHTNLLPFPSPPNQKLTHTQLSPWPPWCVRSEGAPRIVPGTARRGGAGGVGPRAGGARGVGEKSKSKRERAKKTARRGADPPGPPLPLSQTNRMGLKEPSFHATVAKSVARNVSDLRGWRRRIGGRVAVRGGRREAERARRPPASAPALAKLLCLGRRRLVGRAPAVCPPGRPSGLACRS